MTQVFHAVIMLAEKLRIEAGDKYTGTEHLLLAIIKLESNGQRILHSLGVEEDDILKGLSDGLSRRRNPES